jgi:resolvase-like protein
VRVTVMAQYLIRSIRARRSLRFFPPGAKRNLPQDLGKCRHADGLEARPARPIPARPDNDAGRSQAARHPFPVRHRSHRHETSTDRAMRQMIGVLAELERSMITARSRAGVKAAQGRGVKFGRKPKLSRQLIERRRPAEGGRSVQNSRKTLYRMLAT